MKALHFDTNVLVAAERAIGKPMLAIVDELQSDAGASLTTLRALVAAGRSGACYPDSIAVFLDEPAAGKLIDEFGTEACAAAVGKELKAFFERVAR